MLLHKKWCFPLRIFSVNVTKSASHLLKKSLMENFIFCTVLFKNTFRFTESNPLAASTNMTASYFYLQTWYA